MGGKIIIGVNDAGEIIGVDDTDSISIECAQLLKDSVHPDVSMNTRIGHEIIEDKEVVFIDVEEGSNKPYYLREKGLRAEGVFVRRVHPINL